MPPAPTPGSDPSAPGGAARACERAGALVANVERALHGKRDVVERAVATWLAGGHLLLEDVPGVGKTTLARALARSVEGDFARIQFTNDLLPSDITGLSVPETPDGRPSDRFRFQPGPLFAHVVLADEINRASPKSQSALLEAMSERTVSVDGATHALPEPFFVVATQNPLEHAGTHALPESQLDRFLMRLTMGYPEREAEQRVLLEDPGANALPALEPVVSLAELRALQAAVRDVKLEPSLVGYLLDLATATREHDAFVFGVSTRGALALRSAAQARALIDGRDFCIPEDVRDLAVDVLAHRVGVSSLPGERDATARFLLAEILDEVPVPL